MLARVNRSRAAVSVRYFAGMLAGSCQCPVGLVLEMMVLFPARTALRMASVLIRKCLFAHSLCPSFRPPMHVLLAQLQGASAHRTAGEILDRSGLL